MTQPSQSPQCLIRPAQAGDRSTIDRLLDQFHQSLDLPHLIRRKPMPRKILWAIVLVVGAWLIVLALHGFYSHALALAILLLLVLKDDWIRPRSLANFWVVDCRNEVIGCAKLLPYDSHSEAYLVYVDVTWRGQGYGSCLVQRLTEEATLPLYLASQPHRLKFYQRLGFVPVSPDALPMGIRNRLGVDRYQAYGIVAMVFGQGKRQKAEG